MRRSLKNLFHRPAVRMGPVDNSRLRERTHTKNAQFVSFLAESGFRRVNADRYEQSMRRRKLVLVGLAWAFGALFAWVALESAHALTLF